MAAQIGLTLFQAWKVHWEILFPEEPNCEMALRDWVMSSLAHFCPDKPFLPRQQIECAIPNWFSKLDVQIDLDGARIGLEQTPQQVAPWFANTLPGWKRQWIRGHADHVHPFERLVGTPTEDKINHGRWSKESYYALRNVTLRIGAHIQREMEFKLRAGHLHAVGLDSRKGAAFDGVEIVRLLNDGYVLDVLQNSISARDFRPPITGIGISKSPFFADRKNLPHSFKDFDVVLFERMKEMIETMSSPTSLVHVES
ncbi:hypothetical protein WNZ14_08910 [Hoeflea sp. AS60]|uniref:hypothetical protein n=1 Tax=Hoeflea sp. AS60 TaxID=3135780 RepID=UPI0031783256